MKKQISIIIIITVMMQLLFNIIFPMASIAAGEETVTITCKDVNFYNGLKEQLGEKIQSSVDSTMTITMTKTNVESITEIDMNNYTKQEKITDITGIEKFTKLTILNLSYNNIKDISLLAGLTELTQLSLAGNQIVDIKVLENFKGLTSLSLSYNGLSNIATIGQLTKLKSLKLTGNKISNIAPLKTLTELKNLNLSNNNIDDLDDIKNIAGLSTFEAKNQMLSAKVSNEGVAELPKIFSQAKEQGNKCYTEEDFTLTNCTLNEDGKSITVTNKIMSGSVQIKGGAADGTILTTEDTVAPEVEVSYNTTLITNQNVTVTIKASEPVQEVQEWTLSTDKLSLTKTYSKNVEKETVTIKDLAGNTTTVDISIKNIDKVAPKLSVSYTSTNTSVTVTIQADEKLQQLEGWELSEDLTKLTKTYTKNIQEEVIIKDLAGNSAKVSIKVMNIPENSNNSQSQSEEQKADSSTSGKFLPYTGINYITGVAIIVAIIGAIYFKKLRKLKDIK